jgi:FMN phosphatase YigB (HAD superfamily)
VSTNIFLDFAETLGYAVHSEKEFDYLIIKSILGDNFDVLESEYGNKEEENDLISIYSKSVNYKNISEEKSYCLKYFKTVLTKHCHKNKVSKLAELVTDKKFSLCRHRLYPEVLNRLNNYVKFANVFVLSDGKPSRKITLEFLGIDKYFSGCFISDEIGVLKDKTNFYKIVLSRINISGRIIFIDDLKTNLDAFGRVCEIEKYLIDRRGVNKELDISYKYINKLPINFNKR